jgi:Protein of unknown function (DUF2591)
MATKYKVLELAGWQLDAAVHWAQERLPEEDELRALGIRSLEAFYTASSEAFDALPHQLLALRLEHPSRDWLVGGALIERERVALEPTGLSSELGSASWTAHIHPEDSRRHSLATGGTPLEAAMRAFVYMEVGATVELPL